MARENKTSVPAVISNQEILAEINLISQIQQIETRLATEPDSIRFGQLADAYLGIGDFDHAIELCEQGLKTHPQYDTGMLVLTKSYYLSGNKKKAKEILQDFLISHPASLAGHKLLGDLSLEEDDVVETVAHYRVALRFDPINRQIIQTLVDLKDKYQKIKESKTSEEEEEQEVATVAKKVELKIVAAEKPLEKIQPVIEQKPVVKPAQAKEETKLDSFIEDAIQPSEDKFDFKPAEIEPAKIEPVIAKREEKPTADKQNEFTPVYTDAKGIMYFYDDDEVSFDQYKKRLDLQKAGKALILERALLDQKLTEIGIKTEVKPEKEIPKDDVFAQTESAFDMEITPREFEFEPKATKVEEKPGKEEPKRIPTFEEHIDESMAREEEELLSAAEQEAALSDIEISYKDYLDILTNEEDLLEALFQEEHEADLDEEKEDVAGQILRTAMGEEEPVASEEKTDLPIAYLDYVQSLESELEIQEASFVAEPLVDENEESINFGEFSAYLDHSDDIIDFNSYVMLLEADGISPDTLWEKAAVIEEPVLGYKDYIASASDTEKTDALFEIQGTDLKQETVKKETIVEPVVEEVIAEIKTVEEKIVEKQAEQPVVLTEAVKEKEETKPVVLPEIKEEITKAEDEYEDEYIEEEINPQDATPELVEKLAARGQFGSAYKVCKMLKVKNPTDAKVDRKILELKRLYVWSSQMVG